MIIVEPEANNFTKVQEDIYLATSQLGIEIATTFTHTESIPHKLHGKGDGSDHDTKLMLMFTPLKYS